MYGYLRCSDWEVAVLRDFAQAQCFSFVLIRHSQSCWLRGWFCCEIMSLIKRSSTHEKASVIKPRSVGGPPSSLKATPPPLFFHLLPQTRGEQGKNGVAWSGHAAHIISRLATLTHLRRWKTVTVIFEVVATTAEQHKSVSERSLNVFHEIHCIRACWLEHEMQHNKRSKRCHRPVLGWEDLGPFSEL